MTRLLTAAALSLALTVAASAQTAQTPAPANARGARMIERLCGAMKRGLSS